MGHEAIGVVEQIGSEVTTLELGDTVIVPFAYSDNTCPFCRDGFHTSCQNGGFFDGADSATQAEKLRIPLADGTAVKIPAGTDEVLMPSLLTLADVYLTGYHAAHQGGVGPDTTVVVIGDGAVGLSGVLASRQLGADMIILMGRHTARTDLGRDFGATHVVAERGNEGIAKVMELTDGQGAHVVLEAVGHMPRLRAGLQRPAPRRDVVPGRRAAVRGRARRIRLAVRQERHSHRWPRPGQGLHRIRPPASPGRFDRTRTGVRPGVVAL
jgi:threonine dehydrogenase-like Zn-dependent dehydrogenase